MDQSFFLRAQRMLDGERPAALDHSMLAAALAAHQASSPTAREEARLRQEAGAAAPAEPLPELILGAPRWPEAAAAQGGCFNRSMSRQGVNGS